MSFSLTTPLLSPLVGFICADASVCHTPIDRCHTEPSFHRPPFRSLSEATYFSSTLFPLSGSSTKHSTCKSVFNPHPVVGVIYVWRSWQKNHLALDNGKTSYPLLRPWAHTPHTHWPKELNKTASSFTLVFFFFSFWGGGIIPAQPSSTLVSSLHSVWRWSSWEKCLVTFRMALIFNFKIGLTFPLFKDERSLFCLYSQPAGDFRPLVVVFVRVTLSRFPFSSVVFSPAHTWSEDYFLC